MEITDILRMLSRRPGVRGAAVLTHDGIPVQCEPALRLDRVWDPAGHCIREINGALLSAGLRDFERLTVTSSLGRVAFIDACDCYLVQLLDPWCAPDFRLQFGGSEGDMAVV